VRIAETTESHVCRLTFFKKNYHSSHITTELLLSSSLPLPLSASRLQLLS
jgi:hypothetical protein